MQHPGCRWGTGDPAWRGWLWWLAGVGGNEQPSWWWLSCTPRLPGQQHGPQPPKLFLPSSCSCALQKGQLFWEIGISVENCLWRSSYGKQVLLLTGWEQVALHSLAMSDPALRPCNLYAIFIKDRLYGADIVQVNMFLLLLFKPVTSTEKCKIVFCFMVLVISCTVHNVYPGTLLWYSTACN